MTSWFNIERFFPNFGKSNNFVLTTLHSHSSHFQKQLQEGNRLTQNLQAQLENLQRSKKAYDKAYRDNEKALENFQKADADLHLSRAEVFWLFFV